MFFLRLLLFMSCWSYYSCCIDLIFFLHSVIVFFALVLLLFLCWYYYFYCVDGTVFPTWCYKSLCIGDVIILMLVLPLFFFWCCHSFHISATIPFALVLKYLLAQPLLLLRYFLAQPLLLLFSH